MVMSHEILQLFLSLGHFAFQDIGLFFFGVVELVDLRQFLFGLDSQSLCDVEVVVGSLVVHLVGGQLLLGGVEAHADFFFVFLDLLPAGLGFLVFEFELFLSFEVLLLEFFLEASVECVVCGEELEIFLASGVSHELSFRITNLNHDQ